MVTLPCGGGRAGVGNACHAVRSLPLSVGESVAGCHIDAATYQQPYDDRHSHPHHLHGLADHAHRVRCGTLHLK